MAFGFTAPDSWSNVLTTALNSLAATQVATSSTITPPTSPRRLYIDWALHLAQFNNSALFSLAMYYLPCLDDPSSPSLFARIEDSDPVHGFKISSGNTVKDSGRMQLWCPNRPFKVALMMPSGATTLASSGNTLAHSFYAEE